MTHTNTANAGGEREELRQGIRKILQSGPKNMWRAMDHEQSPQPNYEDDIVAYVDERIQAAQTDRTRYEFAKELILRQLDYMQKRAVFDTEKNAGEREEAERNLSWLRDIATTEFASLNPNGEKNE
jgi:hypothetical protein